MEPFERLNMMKTESAVSSIPGAQGHMGITLNCFIVHCTILLKMGYIQFHNKNSIAWQIP